MMKAVHHLPRYLHTYPSMISLTVLTTCNQAICTEFKDCLGTFTHVWGLYLAPRLHLTKPDEVQARPSLKEDIQTS